jgi:hypothetical protein
MKFYNIRKKKISKLTKHLWPLTPVGAIYIVSVILFCGSVSALVIQYAHTSSPVTKKTAAASSDGSNNCLLNTSDCPNSNNSPKSTQVKTATPTPTATPQSNNVSSCSAVVATRTSYYNDVLSTAWRVFNDESANYTPAEINYEYNQQSQDAYNASNGAIKAAGCTSNLTLSLKYPATDPADIQATPATSATPTCDATQEASYQSSYDSQYQSLLEQEREEIQSVQAQMAAAGAGDSSGYNAVPSEVAQQFNAKFGSIKSTLNSELTSINCPTQ